MIHSFVCNCRMRFNGVLCLSGACPLLLVAAKSGLHVLAQFTPMINTPPPLNRDDKTHPSMRPLNGGGGGKSQEKQCVAALMTPLLEKPGVRGPSTTGGDVVKKKLPAIICHYLGCC